CGLWVMTVQKGGATSLLIPSSDSQEKTTMLKNTLKNALYLAIAAAVFGCGGKDKLTDVQKERLLATVQSVGNVSTSVKQADQRRKSRTVLHHLAQVVDQGDRRVDKMVNSLELQVQEGVC